MPAGTQKYTTQLQAGLGLIEETKLLLTLYEPGMSSSQLYDVALASGMFPMVSARRLRNIVVECFSPRYMKSGAAEYLKRLVEHIPSSVSKQLFLVYTAGANAILHDFIQDVYWDRYSGGRDTLSTDDARDFVIHAVREGKTQKPWSDSTIKKVSSYLIGACADYGMLSSNRSSMRTIQPIRIEQPVVLYLVYKLHLEGLGDNAVVSHHDWKLFGLGELDVRDELKRLALRGWLIMQSAGEVTHISWQFKNMEEVIDVIAQS